MFNKFSIAGVNALPRFGNTNECIIDFKDVRPINNQIGVYIHIPFCKSICQFCMLRREAKAVKQVPDEYVLALLMDIELYKHTLENVSINSIYFGGGTPSMLSPKQFELLLSALLFTFKTTANFEITFEGEPSSLNNTSLLSSLKDNKVDRISFGLQTLDLSMRKLLGRTDTVNEIFQLFEKVAKYNFKEVNIDYMYNLPNTSIGFIEKDLDLIKSLGPTSIDCHPLKYISCSKHMLSEIVLGDHSIPNSTQRIAMFNYIRQWHLSNGYQEQFVDQYSIYKVETTNKYMQNLYGLNGGEYIGIGPGSRSHLGNYGISKISNLDSYMKCISLGKTPIEKIVYAPMIDNFIACFPKRNDSLSLKVIEDSESKAYYAGVLKEMLHDGYIDVIDDKYILTSFGLNWYQNLQEILLSPIQRRKHRESTLKRIEKFKNFGNYFDELGVIL